MYWALSATSRGRSTSTRMASSVAADKVGIRAATKRECKLRISCRSLVHSLSVRREAVAICCGAIGTVLCSVGCVWWEYAGLMPELVKQDGSVKRHGTAVSDGSVFP